MTSIRAAVLTAIGERLSVEDLVLEGPHKGEVLVRMAASGVCGSCVHAQNGSHAGVPLPIVLGDEGAGIVEGVGPGCSRLGVGDHVVISWAPGCGSCRSCLRGRPALCDRQPPFGFMTDGRTRFTRGATAVHHYGPATYAEAIVVSERAAVKIPDDVPLETAALVGCAVTAGFGAVANSAGVRAGESVLVVGCGGVGLSAIQAARALGAAPIIAADTVPSRREAALRLGADDAVDAASGDALQEVLELSAGGVDASVAAVGAVAAIELAIGALGRLGTCVVVGAPATGSTVSFDPFHVLNGERRIVGGKYGSDDPHLSFPRIIELYRRGRLPLDSLISTRYGIEEVNAAHADLEAGRGTRGLIVFP